MARQSSISIENDFSRGLITEATGISFPENAATELFDVVLHTTKKVTRRKGFEYEMEFTQKTIDRDGGVVSSYFWKNVTGDGDTSLLVLQVGGTLYFYKGVDPLSGGALATTITLSTFSPSGSPPAPDPVACTFSDGNGLLFVTHPDLDAFRVAYTASNETVAATQIDPETRDFQGLDSGIAVDSRPAGTTFAALKTANKEHAYNLLNQGWAFNEGSSGPIDDWDTARTDMPSNADAWWYYLDTSGDWADAEIARYDPGNAPAAKGHFILNVFSKDRTTASGVASITTVTTGNKRFSTSAFFAGRMFWSGINSTEVNSSIFFTQIVERDEQYGFCYQKNDPATDDIPDLLADDGGVIDIPEAGTIVKLIVVQASLIVFATNGIWAISGSQGLGFAANDFSVAKISSIGHPALTSFVIVEGLPMWWNPEGIYALNSDQAGLAFQAREITENTIKTFFDLIPQSSRKVVKGAYNPDTKVVQWLYQTAESSTIDDAQEYDAVLNFHSQLGAFHPWTISAADAKVHDIFILEGTGGNATNSGVTSNSGADNVQDAGGDEVIVWTLSSAVLTPAFKYITSATNGAGSYNFTFSEAWDVDYLDWTAEETTGVAYESYLITGYKIRGDTMRMQQSNYIQTYFDKETNASCNIQGRWDWSANSLSGKFSTIQEAYSTRRDNFDINFRRLKIRGKGRSLQLRLSSSAGQPFTLLGWSSFDSVNATI